MLIPDLIAGEARRPPDAVALVAPGRAPLSYGDLGDTIRTVVAGLRAVGLGRDARVAVLAPDGVELATAVLGVTAGATCIPLNPGSRPAELGAILGELRASAMLISDQLDTPARGVAAARDLPVVDLTSRPGAPAGQIRLRGDEGAAAGTVELAGPSDVALVLLTSGTTARPKRVPLTHANLRASAQHVAASLALGPSDRCLNAMPLFHIHGLVAGLLASLATGGSVVCPPGFLAPQFFTWLEEFRPSWYTAVPTMHQAILAQASRHPAVITRGRLRFIRSSSAPLPVPVLREMEQVFGVPVIESYGMTEAAHQIASNPLPPGIRKPGSVGRPAGPDVAILNGDGCVVPAGTTGEVVIRGANVTRGYENETEARPGDRWLRTGDLGLLDHDGYLFISGRLKELINRGGEKVAPREVEEVLHAHPDVAQAAVFPVPSKRLGEDVAAAVVRCPGAVTTARELRAFVASQLAPFKVPHTVVFVDRLPVGPTGKLQRLGLAETLGLGEEAPARSEGSGPPPTTTREVGVAEIWTEILGRPPLGVEEDFLQAGGDSILAARIIARLRAAFGVELSFIDFFDAPTVAGLAAALDTTRAEAEAAPRATGAPPGGDPGAVSYAQQRLWFLDQLEPGDAAYNRPVAMRLAGTLDLPALQRSLDELVRRHEALRTTFRSVEGQPIPRVEPPRPVAVVAVDCTAVPALRREEEVRRRATDEARRAFDLGRGPLVRATLLRLKATEHVLLLVFHHIAFDGWSEPILRRELAALYTAFTEGRPSPLPELRVQYADYARWQRQQRSGSALDDDLAYWTARLAGPLPILEVPADRPRPAHRSSRGALHSMPLSGELTEALEQLSRDENATLFMTLLAAFGALLHRYTGETDLLVGTPVAGRTHVELEPLIGVFINTLVLRTDLAGDPTFRELVRQTRAVTLEALEHQDVPFERLVEALQPERSLSVSPLFQVMFQLRNVPESATEMLGLWLQPFEFDPGIARFDLAVDIARRDDGLSCLFEFNTDLFDAATVARLARHFRNVLESVVTDPGRRLSRLPLLRASERQRLLVDWNATEAMFPETARLHHLVDAQAARTPEAVAVVFGDQRLTYRELDRRANQLARRLRSLGVGRDTPVAICAERSVEMVVGVLGILKAAGAYVPLDPADPGSRLAAILADTKAPLLLTLERLAPRLPEHEGLTLMLDAEWESIGGEPALDPEVAGDCEDLAYVIYTSGSTGTPKGVMVSHRAIVNHLHWRQSAFPMDESDAFLQKASLAFDISVWEIFAPLIAGARLVLAGPGAEKDPGELVRLIREQRITTAHFGPAMLQAFLDEPAVAQCESLRRVFCGGEPLPVALAEQFFSRLRAELYHQYGPTEACVDATVWSCLPGEGRAVVPIGRPIANTQIYIVDGQLEPVPIGVPGELCIGGVGLARGYLNRADQTAERFITSPFHEAAGTRLYRTGDVARYRLDGTIEFLGRLDHQVKLRGFRIELGEVEAVLTQHPAVRDAVAVVRDDPPGDRRLVAYLTSRDGHAVSPADLRNFVKERLPDYMVPSTFVILDALPLTTTGKVDRRALPAPPRTREQDAQAIVMPRTALEESIAGIWREVLGLDRIGIHDNFFDLGGHSLLATRIVARVRDAFGVDLRLKAFFETPTVAHLSSLVADDRGARSSPDGLANLLDVVEGLPEDRARALLAEVADDGGTAAPEKTG